MKAICCCFFFLLPPFPSSYFDKQYHRWHPLVFSTLNNKNQRRWKNGSSLFLNCFSNKPSHLRHLRASISPHNVQIRKIMVKKWRKNRNEVLWWEFPVTLHVCSEHFFDDPMIVRISFPNSFSADLQPCLLRMFKRSYFWKTRNHESISDFPNKLNSRFNGKFLRSFFYGLHV